MDICIDSEEWDWPGISELTVSILHHATATNGMVPSLNSHLNANDLCSVTLVSRSLFAAARSHLYRALFFHRKQTVVFPIRAGRDYRVPPMSNSPKVIAHPAYAVYVRVIGQDITMSRTYGNAFWVPQRYLR